MYLLRIFTNFDLKHNLLLSLKNKSIISVSAWLLKHTYSQPDVLRQTNKQRQQQRKTKNPRILPWSCSAKQIFQWIPSRVEVAPIERLWYVVLPENATYGRNAPHPHRGAAKTRNEFKIGAPHVQPDGCFTLVIRYNVILPVLWYSIAERTETERLQFR